MPRGNGVSHGENHHFAILTNEQVLTARDLVNAKIENVSELARWYGVTSVTMWYAVHGEKVSHFDRNGYQRGTWKHLPNSADYTGHDWFGTRADNNELREDKYWKDLTEKGFTQET